MAAELTGDELGSLGRCPFFRGAEEDLLRRILSLPGVSAEGFSPGETVYQPHRFRRCLGFLLSGQVQVTNGPLSVSVLEAGELFGAAALYNDLPDYATTLTHPVSVRAAPGGGPDRGRGQAGPVPALRRGGRPHARLRHRSGPAAGPEPGLPVPGL